MSGSNLSADHDPQAGSSLMSFGVLDARKVGAGETPVLLILSEIA
jgi:hypothetical protein